MKKETFKTVHQNDAEISLGKSLKFNKFAK
jgi:hypothetical protein